MEVVMKIAILQTNVLPSQVAKNLANVLSFIEQAKKSKADLIILPDLCLTGIYIGSITLQHSFLRECEAATKAIVSASKDTSIIFGNIAVDWDKKSVDGAVRKYNALFIAQNGKLVQTDFMPNSFIAKTVLLDGYDVSRDGYFYSYNDLARENNASLNDYLKPIELNINGEKIKLAPIISEDCFGYNDVSPSMEMITKNGNVDLFVKIASSSFTMGKTARRITYISRAAKKYGVPLIYVNNVGVQNVSKDVHAFVGASSIYSGVGELLHCLPLYQETIEYANFDVATKSFTFERSVNVITPKKKAAEVFDTIAYAIKEFCASIGVERIIIGVSGGIDSAVSTAIYTHVFGADNILLVNMPSKFNSNTTKNIAKSLATNLGTKYMVMPIQQSLEYTVEQIETTEIENMKTGEKTSFKVSDFVKENIQARDRSSRILSALTACYGAVFTCNANKSESTAGYATLYGDAAGFFCAIADLWKFEVYELANYINDEVYKSEVIPSDCINIVPSAELSSNQNVDEGKGDPIKYEYHDYLFRSLVESHGTISPEEILAMYIESPTELEHFIGCGEGLVSKYFPTAKEFIDDLEYWWNAFNGLSVAKRLQVAPLLVLSEYPLSSIAQYQGKAFYSQKYLEMKASICK